MELQSNVKAAISLAAVRAKLLFDTYGWKWIVGVPSVSDIEAKYIALTTFAMEMGNSMSGHLKVEYIDEHWEFGIMLSEAWTEPLNEKTSSLENAAQLGLTESD